MDDTRMSATQAEPPETAEALLRENRRLKSLVVELSARLSAAQQQAGAERKAARVLRQTNEQLVMLAFRAERTRKAAEKAHAQADAARARQTLFLSMLAHELRNPLATIAVANSVMGTLGIRNARLDKLLAIVKRQSGHVVRLVDDLLDASRIATGKISLELHLLDLRDVIDCALETAQATLLAREQGARVDFPTAPLLLVGDRVRLAQLFSNLLGNASKFSPPRQDITLTATVQGSMVEVAVRDQGKGIDARDQGRIFDLFAQGAQERADAWAGGLGIGLTLVRSIAALHGGSVRVESEGAGCGSTFIVLLPLAGHGEQGTWADAD